MYTFLVYDKKTGEYVGKRETSQRYPMWQQGVEAVRKEQIPFNMSQTVLISPQFFKRSKGRFVELNRKEKDKLKLNRRIDIK